VRKFEKEVSGVRERPQRNPVLSSEASQRERKEIVNPDRMNRASEPRVGLNISQGIH